MKRLFLLLTLSYSLTSCEQPTTTREEPAVTENQPAPAQLAAKVQQPPFARDTFAEEAASLATRPIEQAVLGIRKEVARINSLPLTIRKRRFVCDAENTITYYTANGTVVKIVLDWGFVGDGTSRYEYYYKDGKLLFTYKAHTGGPAGLPETRLEERTYVQNDRTIRYLKNQQVSACPVCRFEASAREYNALSAYTADNVAPALCK
ncbi:hypothetical protein [Hymenobacter metallilatus]|uniref:Lipoprotein n=1 Tax=Hymenobacter metallilatus TaxID=2493666 RepID=A0A3R9P7E8_9BACT|nr:hypothetical protein [Hymenobacter metallilatus]RSK30085.1 hypothetical protein EI290_14600 [Hymenobacter metallilatus]